MTDNYTPAGWYVDPTGQGNALAGFPALSGQPD